MTITALLEELDLGIDTDLALDNDPYVVQSATTRVNTDEWVLGSETIEINGKEHTFSTKYAFHEPRLTSIQFRETDARTMQNRQDFSATIVSKRELEVLVGETWVPAQTLVREMLRAGSGSTRADLDVYLASYGFNQNAENPMYLQLLGASRSQYDLIEAEFRSIGAEAGQVRSSQENTRVLSNYRLRGGGLPVAYMEIGTADRSKSQSGTGFVGFLEATLGVFNAIVAIDKERSILRKDDSDEARVREAELRSIFASLSASRPFRNWGGLSAVPDIMTDQVAYYSQQVPCGRLGVVIDGEISHWDVWSNNQGSAAATAPTEQAPVESLQNLLNEDDAEG